jgi:hypothetical protein
MAVSTERTDALNLSMDLAQAGAVFNDATRLLDGGLWSQPNANNQTPHQIQEFQAEGLRFPSFQMTP